MKKTANGKSTALRISAGRFCGALLVVVLSLFRCHRTLWGRPRHPRSFYAPPPVATLPSPAPPALFCCRRRSLRSLPRHPRRLVHHFHAVLGIVTPSHVITGLDPVIHVAGWHSALHPTCCAHSPKLLGPRIKSGVTSCGGEAHRAILTRKKADERSEDPGALLRRPAGG
jgi:hypothetical protein